MLYIEKQRRRGFRGRGGGTPFLGQNDKMTKCLAMRLERGGSIGGCIRGDPTRSPTSELPPLLRFPFFSFFVCVIYDIFFMEKYFKKIY